MGDTFPHIFLWERWTGEELGAYQSIGHTPKPSCSCSFYHIGSAEASDGEGLHEYEAVDWNCLWHRPSSPTSEYESDYDPSSMGRSLSAQWNGSQLTDTVLCPFHYAFDNVENFPVERELQEDPYRFAHFQGAVTGCEYCRISFSLGEGPCQRCSFGGALSIITHSSSGREIHNIADCGTLSVQGFLDLHGWTNVSVIWQHHVLHPDLLFADYKLGFFVLLIMPHCPNTDDMTEILIILKAAHHAPCQSEYYGHNSIEYAHRGWLADIIDRRNQAIDMMSSWRNTRRRITRKR
eukprot:5190917-Amphidinium_carterae.1